MVNTLCIVQARLTSSRLPNKVLMKLGTSNKTVLEHVNERLRKSKFIDEVVFAIPDTPLNDPLEKFLQEHNIPYIRGSENDVLERFYQCSLKYNPDVIVRATCDNPCVDWVMTDKMIEMLKDNDYVKYHNAPLGTGVEVFTYSSFLKVHTEATTEAQHEHVTPYYYQHPELFRIGVYEFTELLSRDYRLTMDTEEDNQVMQDIYTLFYKGSPFTNTDLYAFLEANPLITEKNKDVEQKTV